jgi:hypothetical protein
MMMMFASALPEKLMGRLGRFIGRPLQTTRKELLQDSTAVAISPRGQRRCGRRARPTRARHHGPGGIVSTVCQRAGRRCRASAALSVATLSAQTPALDVTLERAGRCIADSSKNSQRRRGEPTARTPSATCRSSCRAAVASIAPRTAVRHRELKSDFLLVGSGLGDWLPYGVTSGRKKIRDREGRLAKLFLQSSRRRSNSPRRLPWRRRDTTWARCSGR